MKLKISREKRNQLLLVVMGTLAVLGALGFGLIKFQYENLAGYARRQVAAEGKLQEMENAVKRRELVKSVFAQASQALAEQEVTMASGDLYAWMYGTVRKFQKGYPKVDVPQLSPVSAPVPVNLLPAFPYSQVTMQIGGTAYFHDLGQFVADFENEFPLIRVVNLSVELPSAPVAGDREKLAFKMDLVALVKAPQP
jgi:hypothetical protein